VIDLTHIPTNRGFQNHHTLLPYDNKASMNIRLDTAPLNLSMHMTSCRCLPQLLHSLRRKRQGLTAVDLLGPNAITYDQTLS